MTRSSVGVLFFPVMPCHAMLDKAGQGRKQGYEPLGKNEKKKQEPGTGNMLGESTYHPCML